MLFTPGPSSPGTPGPALVHVVHGQGLLLVPGSLRLPCQLLGVSLTPPYDAFRAGHRSIANHAHCYSPLMRISRK